MAKRVVHELDFQTEGAHVAMVTKGANQQSVLLMKKSDEVQISTSMQTFLTTFFYMWESDAKELTKILGYEPQEWSCDIIGDDTEVTLLKSLDKDSKISPELYGKIEKMGEKFTNLLKEGKTMPKKKVEDVVTLDLQKSIDDAVKIALEKQEAETAKLEKSLEERELEITNLKKAEDGRVKEGFVELCKGYSFVEDATSFAETLFLCKGIDGFDTILDTLEKARTVIKEALEGEVGTDEEADLTKSVDTPKHLTKTAELIKARYSKESK